MTNLKKLFELLNKKDRIKILWIAFLVLIMALLDVIGIASIMPFMAVLANPEIVESNIYLQNFYNAYHFDDTQNFLFFLGVCVFCILVFTLIYKAITNYVLFKFILVREYEIGGRLIEKYLDQPYSWFLNKNSAELGKSLLSEVNQVILNSLLPLMTVVSQSILVVLVILFLIFINTELALLIGGSLFITYFVLFRLTTSFLSRIGVSRLNANEKRFRAVIELFGAIKEVKVARLENIYISRFKDPSKIYANHQATAMVVSQLPKFAIEGLAFGGMLGVTLYLMIGDKGIADVLPIITAYVFAAYRLMPAMQQIYSGISLISYSSPSITALHESLYEKVHKNNIEYNEESKATLNKEIEFKDISFKYESAEKNSIQNINLKINKGSKVGLVGPSGSGKTTTVDVLLGLLSPQSGSILIDGTPLNSSNRFHWQKSIGYVPQHIYLADDTLSANIAFGVEESDIDIEAVKVASERALLHDYVLNEMPNGYSTIVGERGARLSGGQRQRIGIARALYRNPSILILDEATSSLDNLTEKSVMDAVHGMGDITILMIAHRLSTVKKCDTIFLLNNGVVESQGTFEELKRNNQIFRAMTDQESK